MKLVLGVVVVPYANKPQDAPRPYKVRVTKSGRLHKADMRAAARAFQAPWRHKESGGEDTSTVAEFLEAKYHVMEVFYERHQALVADALAEHYRGKLESLLLGAPRTEPGGPQFLDKVATAFNRFIDNREMDGMTGIPTKASLAGRTSRFKRGVQKGGPRPSFRDTGNFEGSMRSWLEASA